jgi:hypothetical protein
MLLADIPVTDYAIGVISAGRPWGVTEEGWMPYSSSWDVINDADTSQVILSVDVPLAVSPQLSFAELAGRIGPQYRFLQARLPAADDDGRPLAADTYVSPWIEELRYDPRPVLAVLGYSCGSVYAAAIAEGIAQWQQMPTVILLNPRVASMELLDREFHREIASISSLLSDDEIERSRKIAAEISESAAGNLSGAAAEIITAYREVSTAAFERVGIGGVCSDRFTKLFEACISCISMAGLIDPATAWRHSTAIVSCDYLGAWNGGQAANGAGILTGRQITLDVADVGLLRSASTAEQVLMLLEPGR